VATPRVTVFIDYQNVHFSGHAQFCPQGAPAEDCLVDPLKLAELLVARRAPGGTLEQVRVYRGRPSPAHQPGLASYNDQQFSAWIRDARVDVIRRPLWYPEDFGEPGCNERPREKGIDVKLAIDLVRMGLARDFDAAILCSRDTDLVPALEMLRDRDGAHVEVASWEGKSRLRLDGGKPLWCHTLTGEDFNAVKDTRHYTRK
jgi:uncharacterized LabA/DUF88 family protein